MHLRNSAAKEEKAAVAQRESTAGDAISIKAEGPGKSSASR